MPSKIVDGHIHFWDPDRIRLDWTKGKPVLERAYRPSDLFEEAGEDIIVDRIVMIQVASTKEDGIIEARWVNSLAEQIPQVQGIVAFAPLETPDSARESLDIFGDIPHIRGIRRNIQDEALGFARQPAFVRGVQSLADYGYSFDICIYHPQIADVIFLVEQCPDIAFVLDHIGKPGIRDGLMEPWKQQIKQLAAHENVWCKLSGMVTEADHEAWSVEDLKPYVDHVIDCFGVDRLMYGGDWPVVKLASSYQRWFETIRALTANWSEAETQKVFYDNAIRFYRL